MKAILFFALCGLAVYSFASANANKRLLNAVSAGSEDKMHAAIEAGADPNWFGGNRFDQKPLCLATRLGFESMLKALIDAGADPGIVYFPETDVVSADPMSCAAHNRNLNAFRILHEYGADLNKDFCQGCNTAAQHTVLWSALGPERFDIARYIINHIKPTEGQIRVILGVIEKRAVYENDKTLGDREWIAEWLRERGHEVTPREPWPARQ